ncbi:MAG: DivIVA domain-containing protein [Synergistaceae bacterium]|nr:DivIVA domain-containing protein [Synergistaceae bacterium]
MSELLTAKDVEVKVFKKVRFGGYAVLEVEDFLNQVADDLEAYVTQIDEKDNRIQELEAFVKKQESMTDAIKDALIQARKAAKDMEDQARTQTEKILADAQEEARKLIAESGGKVQERIDEAERTAQERINEAERKASEIVARARVSADEIVQTSQDKRTKAEQSLSSIEHELESRRREAESMAEKIIASAREEAQKILGDAEKEADSYSEQLRFLSLRKQQFLKDTVSLLLDFGKIIDRAQEDTDAEIESLPQISRETHEQPENPPAFMEGSNETA